jgi:hypothetical protein
LLARPVSPDRRILLEFVFGEMPEGMRQVIEHQMMHNENDSHEIKNFIAELNESQLRTLYLLMKNFDVNSSSLPFYAGVIVSELSSRFHVCIACGKKHDEELKSMTNPEEKDE